MACAAGEQAGHSPSEEKKEGPASSGRGLGDAVKEPLQGPGLVTQPLHAESS